MSDAQLLLLAKIKYIDKQTCAQNSKQFFSLSPIKKPNLSILKNRDNFFLTKLSKNVKIGLIKHLLISFDIIATALQSQKKLKSISYE